MYGSAIGISLNRKMPIMAGDEMIKENKSQLMALDLILSGPIFFFSIVDDAEYIEYLLDSFVGCLNLLLLISS